MLLIATVAGNFISDLEFVERCNETSLITLVNDDTSVTCFIYRLLVRYKLMDGDGGFLIHNIKDSLKEKTMPYLNYVLYECTAINVTNSCERSSIFVECVWEQQVSRNKFLLDL
ncbi:hypothetical protein RI129_012319 [Pyrocoelia pectoralis]|uniref:Uncharacterized protein n=1 Tax=Pyrocoelia pectoralis TaxID=417401 RepID=A0AAN7V5Z5_9COLE